MVEWTAASARGRLCHCCGDMTWGTATRTCLREADIMLCMVSNTPVSCHRVCSKALSLGSLWHVSIAFQLLHPGLKRGGDWLLELLCWLRKATHWDCMCSCAGACLLHCAEGRQDLPGMSLLHCPR